jgi:hypothetical protein
VGIRPQFANGTRGASPSTVANGPCLLPNASASRPVEMVVGGDRTLEDAVAGMSLTRRCPRIRLAWGCPQPTEGSAPPTRTSFRADTTATCLRTDGMGGREEAKTVAEFPATRSAHFFPRRQPDPLSVDGVRRGRRKIDSLRDRRRSRIWRSRNGTHRCGQCSHRAGRGPYWIVVSLGDSRTYMLADGFSEQGQRRPLPRAGALSDPGELE